MAGFDYYKAHRMKTIINDPQNKVNGLMKQRKEEDDDGPSFRSRQKKTVDSGKGVQRGERVSSGRLENNRGTRGASGVESRYRRAAENFGPEKARQVREHTAKRTAQENENRTAGMYRENYMPAEAYDKYDQMWGEFNNKRRSGK